MRVLGNVHLTCHLLLAHHGVIETKLAILHRAAHSWNSSSWKMIEALHVHHVWEALRHSLEVALHVRHVRNLETVSKVVV